MVLLLALAELAYGLWPQPVSSSAGDGVRSLVGGNFSCTAATPSESLLRTPDTTDILVAACARYEGYLRSRKFPVHRRRGYGGLPSSGSEPLTQLVVTAADTTSEFSLHTNESYTLTIPESGAARLHAPHVVGALRGLETFFQLMQPLAPAEFLVQTPTSVHDAPRWSHRGLLLDTGRHYYPVSFIKHIIEGMAMEKLSVLHWHITEILSFPLVVESVPELADAAAFSPAATYSHEDVAEVVAYARLHGVRVIPELDMPGHMTAWGTALPDKNITMDCGTQHHIANFSQADVSNEETFVVIGKVLKEIAPLFPDRFWGFGGDETCDWLREPRIAAWAAAQSGQPGFEQNMSSHAALFRYFAKRVQAMLPPSKLPAWWNDAVVQNVSSAKGTLYWNWGAGCDKGGVVCPPGDELTRMLRDGRQIVQSRGWCECDSPSFLYRSILSPPTLDICHLHVQLHLLECFTAAH